MEEFFMSEEVLALILEKKQELEDTNALSAEVIALIIEKIKEMESLNYGLYYNQ
jgi:hypothetical protein